MLLSLGRRASESISWCGRTNSLSSSDSKRYGQRTICLKNMFRKKQRSSMNSWLKLFFLKKKLLIDWVINEWGTYNLSFSRNWRNVEAWKSLKQRSPQQVEFFVSPLDLVVAILVRSNDCVNDVIIWGRLLWITYTEILGPVIWSKWTINYELRLVNIRFQSWSVLLP